MIHIYFADIDISTPWSFWESTLSTFPPIQQERIKRFQFDEGKKHRILALWLLADALSNFGHSRKVLENIKQTTKGRPYLEAAPHVDFNISHSGMVAMCAITDKGKVGVDVEKTRKMKISSFDRVFSDKIFSEINNSPAPQQEFLIKWTCLEAIAKAEGFGISGPTKSIHLENGYGTFNDHKWGLLRFQPAPLHFACAAYSAELNPPKLIKRMFGPE
jgi:4'-phosphopantetheinyl transferase